MFSLKLSCLPSSDERFQCEDEGISAYPSALTPAVATFQGQTEWMLAGLPLFLLHTSSPRLSMATYTCGSNRSCVLTANIVFTRKHNKLLITALYVLYLRYKCKCIPYGV